MRGLWRTDPYLAFNFLVEIKGLVSGGFREVRGLQAELEVTDYREGGQNRFLHRVSGPARYPDNLVLRRGLSERDGLWRWHQEAMNGRIERKNISVVLVDTAREEVWRWDFQHAFPIRWTGPELSADSALVAFETLELAHRGLLRSTSGPVKP